MAQYEEEPLRRTDQTEARFNETVPDDQKYASIQPAQDVALHVDKPISVSETGYGGVLGRGNDISATIEAARHPPGRMLDREGGESFTEKAKDMAHGLKDTLTGKKQNEARKPIVDQRGAQRAREGEGFGERMKDLVTGQKPGHGAATVEGSGEVPLNEAGNPNRPSLLQPVARDAQEEHPSATYTDRHGEPVEGPREDNTKKEGIMSKVMDKFNLGATKE